MSISKIKTGESVQKGDLITIGADGRGRYAVEPGTPGSMFRPLSQEATEVIVNKADQKYFIGTDAADGSAQVALASVCLPSGNYAVGFTASGNVQVSTFNHEGHLLNNISLGTCHPEHLGIAMTVLDNGFFAVACSIGEPAGLVVTVFSNDGSLVNDSASVSNALNVSSVAVLGLDDSAFVVAYAAGDLRQPMFALFTSHGSTIGQPITVGATPTVAVTNNQSIALARMTENRFAVVYGSTDGTSGNVKATFFNHNGTSIGSASQIGDSLSLCVVGPFVTAASLTGGGFAVGSYGGIGPGFQLSIFDGDGTQLKTITLDPFDNIEQPNRMALAGLNNGNVGVVWSGPYTYSAVYDPEGKMVFPRNGYALNGGGVAITPTIDGAVITFQGTVNDEGTASVYAGRVSELLVGDVTATDLESGKAFSTPIGFAGEDKLDGNAKSIVIGTINDNVQLLSLVSYTIQQQTLVGVAMEDKDADEELMITVLGSADLRVPFTQPCAVDFNDNPIPGQKMAVIGSIAVMKGIQS